MKKYSRVELLLPFRSSPGLLDVWGAEAEVDPFQGASDSGRDCCSTAAESPLLWVCSEPVYDSTDALLGCPSSADVTDTAEALDAVSWRAVFDAFSALHLLEARLDLGGCCHSLPSKDI